MRSVFHHKDSRGTADHGWLKSAHSFSFANYYNPDRMNFGALRVLNDDFVLGGQGFGKHPHRNMEIVSIPLEGDLEHEDSMGNKSIIKAGDIQIMSAGTGVFHSEQNFNSDKAVKFLQIWIIPKSEDTEPRYEQISLSTLEKDNSFYQVLSPADNEQGVTINQNAWMHIGEFNKDASVDYRLKDPKNGVYSFVLKGSGKFGDNEFTSRDAFGISETDGLTLQVNSRTKILLIEVPMQF